MSLDLGKRPCISELEGSMGFTVIKNDLYFETSGKLNIRFQESWCKELLVLLKSGTEAVGPYLKKNVYPNLPTQGAKELEGEGLGTFVLALQAFRDSPQTFFKAFKTFGHRNAQDVPVPTRLEFLDGVVFNLPATPGGGRDYYNVTLPNQRVGTIHFNKIIVE